MRGVSFTVDAGEIVAVLGPNGAGKTTTIEMLEGFRAPTSGAVRVLGTDPATGGSEFRARIGIVLQETRHRSLPHRRGGAAHARVVLPGAAVGRRDHRARRASPRSAPPRVKTLSGGQQRRLDVGLGIIGDPELLFLDEPTTGFDPSARRQAWDVVHRLRDLGKTVLLTTHYMEEAQALADRLVVIAAGRIIAEGTPDAIGGRADGPQRHPVPVADRPRRSTTCRSPRPATAPPRVIETAAVTTHAAVAHRLGRRRSGVDLDALTVTRPSLEDVYLELVG